ncbi:MAG: DUF1501 domain-containing protein, partial [Isosphaeraceae bacterium]
LEETLVVWTGEFGRTPRVMNTKEFGPDGRDHWPLCYTVLFAGVGTIPGAVRLQRPHRRLPRNRPRHSRRHRRHHVLGSGYRPVHRGARQPEAASAHRGRPADHGNFLVIHAG